MRGSVKYIVIAVVAVIAGIVLFFALWDIPAPTRQIEKEIPGERLGR